MRGLEAVCAAHRILVLGSPGAGKTRLTRSLARRLDLPVIHLDAEFWRPGWLATPAPEWVARLKTLAAGPAWIMDGTYERSLPVRLPRTEVAVVLEAGRAVCLVRVVWRTLLSGVRNRPDAPPGQPLDQDFLRYIWRYPRESAPLVEAHLAEFGAHAHVIRLHRDKGVRRLCRALDAASVRRARASRAAEE